MKGFLKEEVNSCDFIRGHMCEGCTSIEVDIYSLEIIDYFKYIFVATAK